MRKRGKAIVFGGQRMNTTKGRGQVKASSWASKLKISCERDWVMKTERERKGTGHHDEENKTNKKKTSNILKLMKIILPIHYIQLHQSISARAISPRFPWLDITSKYLMKRCRHPLQFMASRWSHHGDRIWHINTIDHNHSRPDY